MEKEEKKANIYHRRVLISALTDDSIKNVSQISQKYEGNNSKHGRYKDALTDLMPKDRGEWREKPLIKNEGIKALNKEEYQILNHPNSKEFLKQNNVMQILESGKIEPSKMPSMNKEKAAEALLMKTDGGQTYYDHVKENADLFFSSLGIPSELVRKGLKKMKRYIKKAGKETISRDVPL